MLQVTHFFGGFLVEFPKQYTLELSNVSLFLLCGARSKEYALLRNVSKLHSRGLEVASECPAVVSELVRHIFQFFDLFFKGKEIIVRKKSTFGRNKEEIIITSGLPRV